MTDHRANEASDAKSGGDEGRQSRPRVAAFLAACALIGASCSSGDDPAGNPPATNRVVATDGDLDNSATTDPDQNADPDELATVDGVTDFTAWATENAQSILSLDLDANPSDLDALESLVGDAKMVAFGETAHNVREQLEMRTRLMVHLVENLGFRLLAAETSMPHAEKINEYVLGADADIDELLRDSGTWELMATVQMRDAIEWVRQYNSTVGDGDVVQFYGVDMTTPSPALESLDGYLRSVNSPMADDQSGTFDGLRALFSQQGDETWRTIQARYDEADGDSLTALSGRLAELQTLMEASEQELVAASSVPEFDQALRWATVLRQGHENFTVQMTAGAPNSPERVVAGSAVRDPAMADNALWVLDQNPDQKMVLWANNLHVHRDDPARVFRVGDDFEISEIPTMGDDLAASLGTAYVVVHGALNGGSTPDYGELADASADSLDGVLNLAGPELFYLDIRAIPDDRSGSAWIKSSQTMRAEVGTLTLPPATSFDAVYFVSSGTSAEEISRP